MIMTFKDEEEHILQQVLSLLKDVTQTVMISTESEQVMSFPGVTILTDQRRVLREEQEIALNRLEYQLLLKRK